MAERYLMTPLARTVLALTLPFSSAQPATTQEADPFDRAITCCIDWRCRELRQYDWRPTKDGIEVMADDAWCSVRLDYYPMIRIFRGVPSNTCDLLRCFPRSSKKQ
jgi:hypothetical protein